MARPMRVLCIMDLAGAGRSSLAVAIPVLAACGVQPCPLPTALFSTHTGGFGEPAVLDTSGFCKEALEHYKDGDIAFDAVYTGYLRGDGQFAAAEAALQQYPDAFLVVDPAIGDGGKLYASITPEMALRMAKLCRRADLITPNFTESALLLGEEPGTSALPYSAMASRMARLAGEAKRVLVTSVPTPEGGMEIWGCGGKGADLYRLAATHVPQSYPGTGDLFAAAVTGLVLRGLSLRKAAKAAADFIRAAAITTLQHGGDARHGIWFEPHLPMLSLAANSAGPGQNGESHVYH